MHMKFAMITRQWTPLHMIISFFYCRHKISFVMHSLWSSHYKLIHCRNPSLGLVTKARACKGVGQKWSPKVTFHASGSVGMWEIVREWTSTLPSELPFWELESQWTPKPSKSNCRDQNLLDWKISYINEKLLELRCLKWARMTHLGN
jgi:hypothetical protein